MTFATNITQKGQITLPKVIRDLLDLRIGDRVGIELVDKKTKKIKIQPLPKLSDLAGSFKVKNPQDPVKIREYMETHYERV